MKESNNESIGNAGILILIVLFLTFSSNKSQEELLGIVNKSELPDDAKEKINKIFD